MSLFYTQLIVPLFNKLNHGRRIKRCNWCFAKRVSFPIQDIFVIDNGKRSSRRMPILRVGKRKDCFV